MKYENELNEMLTIAKDQGIEDPFHALELVNQVAPDTVSGYLNERYGDVQGSGGDFSEAGLALTRELAENHFRDVLAANPDENPVALKRLIYSGYGLTP